MEWIPLPIGVENFEDLREHGYYFVDKTLFIKELLDMKRKVNLFTRPRRFGKTLNMSILRYFFEKGEKDNRPPVSRILGGEFADGEYVRDFCRGDTVRGGNAEPKTE